MYECWCEKQTDERVEKTSETIASCVYQGHAAGVQRVAVFFFSSPNFCHRLTEFPQKKKKLQPKVRANSISFFLASACVKTSMTNMRNLHALETHHRKTKTTKDNKVK